MHNTAKDQLTLVKHIFHDTQLSFLSWACSIMITLYRFACTNFKEDVFEYAIFLNANMSRFPTSPD